MIPFAGWSQKEEEQEEERLLCERDEAKCFLNDFVVTSKAARTSNGVNDDDERPANHQHQNIQHQALVPHGIALSSLVVNETWRLKTFSVSPTLDTSLHRE